MKLKLSKAIAAYEKQVETAEQKLIDKVQPFVEDACKEWGFDFWAGMGRYGFAAAEGQPSQPCKKIDGDYYQFGDADSLIQIIDPDLVYALDYSIEGRQSMGSLLSDVRIDASAYEWVLIKADDWCLNRPVELPTIEFDFDPAEIERGQTYFGWVTRQIAEVVIAEYAEDWDVGSQLLASLPSVDDRGVRRLAA